MTTWWSVHYPCVLKCKHFPLNLLQWNVISGSTTYMAFTVKFSTAGVEEQNIVFSFFPLGWHILFVIHFSIKLPHNTMFLWHWCESVQHRQVLFKQSLPTHNPANKCWPFSGASLCFAAQGKLWSRNHQSHLSVLQSLVIFLKKVGINGD